MIKKFKHYISEQYLKQKIFEAKLWSDNPKIIANPTPREVSQIVSRGTNLRMTYCKEKKIGRDTLLLAWDARSLIHSDVHQKIGAKSIWNDKTNRFEDPYFDFIICATEKECQQSDHLYTIKTKNDLWIGFHSPNTYQIYQNRKNAHKNWDWSRLENFFTRFGV